MKIKYPVLRADFLSYDGLLIVFVGLWRHFTSHSCIAMPHSSFSAPASLDILQTESLMSKYWHGERNHLKRGI